MPTKASITTRTGKGSPLSTAEMDQNLENLRDQSIGFAVDDSTVLNVDSGNTIAIAGGDSISTSISGTTLTVDLDEAITVDSISAGDSSAISIQSPVIASSTIKFNGESTSVSSIKDEDNMASNSATALSTQQSIKAYADTKLANISEDTTPQLGGNLDVNTNSIVSTSNGDITLAPNGSGKVVASNTKLRVNDDVSNVDFANYGGDASIIIKDTTAGSELSLQHYSQGDEVGGSGENIQYLYIQNDTTGTYSFPDSSTASGDIAFGIGFSFTNNYHTVFSQGGELYLSAYGTNSDGGAAWTTSNNTANYAPQDIHIGDDSNDGGHNAVLKLDHPLARYQEKVTRLTDDSTSDIHIDCRAGTVSTFELYDAKEFVFSNLDVGRSHTLIITQTASNTATFKGSDSSAVKFPGGAPTVTTGAGKIDVITVFFDGTNYLGNIAQDYT